MKQKLNALINGDHFNTNTELEIMKSLIPRGCVDLDGLLPTVTARFGLAGTILDTSHDTNCWKYVIFFEVNLNTSLISTVVLRPVLVLWEHHHRPPTPQLKSPSETPPDAATQSGSALKHCITLLHGIYIASMHRQLNALTLELFPQQCHIISDNNVA